MTKEQQAVEKAVERYVLSVTGLLFVVVGVAGVVAADWWLVAFAVVACLLNGGIVVSLPKNRSKSFTTLTQGQANDPAAHSLPNAPAGIADTSFATSAAVKCGYLCAALGGFVAWHVGLPWWQIAITVVGIDVFIMIWGSAVVGLANR